MAGLNRQDAKFAKEEKWVLAHCRKRHYPSGVMTIIIKTLLVMFLISWLGFAAWLLIRFEKLFGYHPDDPAETPGARSLNQTQVWSCWFGLFAVALYFLFY